MDLVKNNIPILLTNCDKYTIAMQIVNNWTYWFGLMGTLLCH
jgi:hypothetical protein